MTYDYNTQSKRMALPEYRRNVQKEVIISELLQLSQGRLKITPGIKILEVSELVPPGKKKPILKQHGKRQNKQLVKKKG